LLRQTFAERWRGIPGHPYEQGFDLKLHPARLQQPHSWKKPRRVFVNSMSDLFHAGVPDAYIAQVFDVMRATPRHTYQVLTKRPDRMRHWVAAYYQNAGIIPPENIWLGVSVENMAYAWRADMLRQTPTAVRFLSLEPLLGPIHAPVLKDMDWIVVGGESGPGARPIDPQWVRDLRDLSVQLGIPYFFKQWGGVHKKKGGRVLDERTWDEYPA
jgi:protein gp37